MGGGGACTTSRDQRTRNLKKPPRALRQPCTPPPHKRQEKTILKAGSQIKKNDPVFFKESKSIIRANPDSERALIQTYKHLCSIPIISRPPKIKNKIA